jgi:hypothetical protein
MALGSVLTLAVLVAAVIEGPKLLRGGKSDAHGVTAAQVAAPAAANPVAATPVVTDPVVTTPAAPESGPVAAATSEPVVAAVPATAPTPGQTFRPTSRAAAPVQNVAPVQQTVQAVPVQQTAQAQAPPPPAQTVTAATASPELKELRDKINRVSVRAAAAQAGVKSMEQRVEQQGFGLRGDIKAASIRLDYVLQEARDSLRNGDVEGARNNLQYAEGTVEKIEKFLGQ